MIKKDTPCNLSSKYFLAHSYCFNTMLSMFVETIESGLNLYVISSSKL